jgi:hypothetical protein
LRPISGTTASSSRTDRDAYWEQARPVRMQACAGRAPAASRPLRAFNAYRRIRLLVK